jgi:hypothetical protein
MLLLTGITDKIRVSLSPAVTTDIHASFIDTDGLASIPGRKNTATTIQTLVDAVSSPIATFSRNVKALHIRNKHASSVVTIVVSHTDGATEVEVARAELAAGELLSFVEGQGFRVYDSNGAIK